MAVYQYLAKDETGKKFTGTYDYVDNVDMLRGELAKMGYSLLKARRKKAATRKYHRIKQDEVVGFAYEFSGMYSAGVSISTCLETLELQTPNTAFREVIADIRQSVETGSSLKDAFAKYRKLFSDFLLGMLEAGEKGGKLGTTLEMSAKFLENRATLRRKIKSAFAYPLIVTVMCLVVVTLLLIFVVPVFSKIYKQLHVSLPGPTQMLIVLSHLVLSWWWAIIIAGIGIVFTFKRLVKNPQVKMWWDTFKLNMPIFSKLNRMVVASHYMRTIALLNSVGVSLLEALDMASLVANNSRIEEISKELKKAIKSGSSVAQALEKTDIFPPMFTQLAVSGEQAGVLSEMLNKGADFLDKDIDRTINALLVKLEPILTLIMGIIVGLILMAVYLPMFDYMSHLK